MKIKFKRVSSLLLSILLIAGSISPTMALEGYNKVDKAGGTGNSNVTVRVEAGTEFPDEPTGEGDLFSAYVPVELPIVATTDGKITVPTDAKIINGNKGRGIKVTEISADIDEGWTGKNYSDDFKQFEVNSKVISLKFKSAEMQADGSFTLNPDEWNISKDSYTDLNMGAKLARWTEPGDLGRAAVANFTLDWSGDDTTEGPVIPDSLRPAVSNSNINIYRESSEVEIGSTVRYKIDWTKFAEGTSLSEVSVRNDTLATVTINEADSDYRLKEAVIEVTGVAEGNTYILIKMSDDTIHEIPVSIIQVVEPEISVEYDNGLMLPGSTNTAMFSWTSPVDGDRIVNLTSSNEDVATVSDSGESAVAYTLNDGTLLANVEAKAKGRATITATLQSGKSASCEVDVSDIQDGKEPTVSTGDKTFEAGATLTPEDVEGNLPVEKSDGTTEDVKVEVSVPDNTVLQEGTNTIPITITVNGKTFTINLVITIAINNPSNGLTTTLADAQAAGFTFESYQDGLKLTGFENTQFKSTINIPEQVGDFKVLAIGDNVFKDQTNIKKVTIPDSVRSTGLSSFNGCTNLTTVVPPTSLDTLGGGSFYGCTSLSEIPLLNVTTIGENALYGCTSLTSLELNNVSTIETSAFNGCTNLSLTLSSTPSTIGTYAFNKVKDIDISGADSDYKPIRKDLGDALGNCMNGGGVVTVHTDTLDEIIPNDAQIGGYILQDVDSSWIEVPQEYRSGTNVNYPGGLGDITYPKYFNSATIPPVMLKVSAGEGTRVHYNLDKYVQRLTYPKEAWVDSNWTDFIEEDYYVDDLVSSGSSAYTWLDKNSKWGSYLGTFWHFNDTDVFMHQDFSGYKMNYSDITLNTEIGRTEGGYQDSSKFYFSFSYDGDIPNWKEKIWLITLCERNGSPHYQVSNCVHNPSASAAMKDSNYSGYIPSDVEDLSTESNMLKVMATDIERYATSTQKTGELAVCFFLWDQENKIITPYTNRHSTPKYSGSSESMDGTAMNLGSKRYTWCVPKS